MKSIMIVMMLVVLLLVVVVVGGGVGVGGFRVFSGHDDDIHDGGTFT